ncbi:hypothetical protein D1122_05185 [Cereibacter sphaeroides]|nr:hypothetical protein D1122_05185 [Cereibacter sphaeroides]
MAMNSKGLRTLAFLLLVGLTLYVATQGGA